MHSIPEKNCLAVKLSAEVCDLSEPMRIILVEGMNHTIHNLANCVRRGQQEGTIHTGLRPDETAYTLYSMWLGSTLLFKTQRLLQPLQAAMAHTEYLLRQSCDSA